MLPKALVLASAALCLGNSPVSPIAQGSLDGILKAAKAARKCGLIEIRIKIHKEISMIFDEGGPSYGGTKKNLNCLEEWTTKKSKSLDISWVSRAKDPR